MQLLITTINFDFPIAFRSPAGMNIPIKGAIMSAVNLEFAISDLIKIHIIISAVL